MYGIVYVAVTGNTVVSVVCSMSSVSSMCAVLRGVPTQKNSLLLKDHNVRVHYRSSYITLAKHFDQTSMNTERSIAQRGTRGSN